MITLINGENAYERDQALKKIQASFEGEVERYDGSEVDADMLGQLVQGQTLFAQNRLVSIKSLSENKDTWQALESYVTDDASSTHLVLLEPKPDKRTKTYKALQKYATIITCDPFSDYDSAKAAAWLVGLAREKLISLEPAAAQLLIARLGANQYMLENELIRLAGVGGITTAVVEKYTEETVQETAFSLLELALTGEGGQVNEKIRRLSHGEDAYMTFGLLVSQVYALSVGVMVGSGGVSKELGVHPFVLKKLRPFIRQLTKNDLSRIVAECTQADMQLKTSSTQPWLVVETLLLRIAQAVR